MSGILNKFYVEQNLRGSRVMTRGSQLTADCLSDDEIDTAIRMLKDDLDARAREMKRLAKVNNSGALFEGWPSTSEFHSDETEGVRL